MSEQKLKKGAYRTISHLLRKRCLGFVLIFGILFLYSTSTWTYFFPWMRLRHGKPCELHILNPWDPSLKDYFEKPPPMVCSDKFSLMHVDQNGYLKFNSSIIKHYNLPPLECVYHTIKRKDGDKEIEIEKIGTPFNAPFFVNSSIFRVVCKTKELKVVYDYVHVNMMWNESQPREDEIGKETDEQLSIIFLGIDSASRSHAIRKLPKSYRYLTETLGAYDFKGFMKVGLNSFPNMFPLLTGENSADHPMATYLREYLDGQPFLWKDSSKAHYTTLYSEDRPDISTFIFNKGGFKNSPVDYCYRPYSLALAEIPPIIVDPLGPSTQICYGNEGHFNLQIKYFKTFMQKYTKRLKFGFLWNNQMGHESFLSLGQGDQPLFELLQWLKSNHHLEKSVLVVGSDHGFRMGGPSTTYIGRLENNMPFLTIYIPKVLKSKYPWIHQNMEYNTQRLISAYDIYETLKDFIYKRFHSNKPPVRNGEINRRSLLSKIPEKRDCLDAGIPVQFCSCHDEQELSTSHPVVVRIVSYTLDNLNALLFNETNKCEKLTLRSISDARVIYIAQGDGSKGLFNWLFDPKPGESGRYHVMFYTHPNNGLIETLVDYKESPKDKKDDMKILGYPIRANKYGNQSHCVRNSTLLKEYCFCSDIKVI